MILPYAIILFILLFILLGKGGDVKACLTTDDSKFDHYCLLLFFLFFYVLYAFRAQDVGNDTVIYRELYGSVAQNAYSDLFGYFTRYEPGYIYFNKLLSDIWSNPQFLFIVSGVFVFSAFYKLIAKYSKFILLSLFLFFTMRIFDDSMNVTRSIIAMALLIYSYSFLRKQKGIPFVLLVFAAALFHKSAIIFLLAWFLVKLKINRTLIVYWVIGLFAAAVLSPQIISFLINHNIIPDYYLDSEYFDDGKIAPLLMLIISMLVSIFGLLSKVYQKPSNGDAEGKVIYDNKNMLIFQMFATLLLIFNIHFAGLLRVAGCFQLFSIILLPNSLKNFKNKQTYFILLILIITIFTLYFAVILTYRPLWNKVYPYSFVDFFDTILK
jgi:hypothetical protein